MLNFPTNAEIKCKLPEPLSGTRYQPSSRNLFEPGETVAVTCGETYWISEQHFRSVRTECKEDGQWTIDPVCKGRQRQIMTLFVVHETVAMIINVMLIYVRSLSFIPEVICTRQDRFVTYWGSYWPPVTLGQSESYRCRDNYKSPDGKNRATCTRYGWSPNPLCQGNVKLTLCHDILFTLFPQLLTWGRSVLSCCPDLFPLMTVFPPKSPRN